MWSIITLGKNCGTPDMSFSECFASVEKEGKLECGIFKRKFLNWGWVLGITDGEDKSKNTLDFTTLPLGQEPNYTSSFFFVCFLFFSSDSLFSLVRG
jgi:hypothetical protein